MEKMVNPKRNDMKNILFAVVGLVPNVVTEALWYFNVKKNIPIEELHIVTTSAGKNVLAVWRQKKKYSEVFRWRWSDCRVLQGI